MIKKNATKKNTTKKNATKKNKTKKIFTGNYIPSNLQLSLNHKYDEKDREHILACYLSNNNIIKNFAFHTFYFMLNYWKTKMHNWKSIIKHSMIEKIDKNTIIKIGFSENELKTIFEYVDKREKHNFLQYLENNFFKVTACLNNLAEPEYTIYHVNFNKKLQNIFIKEIEKIMLIKNIKWSYIKNIYNSLKNDTEKNMYNFFIFDIIYGSNKSVDSIYRTNISNMFFFREKLTSLNHNKDNYIKINNCNKSIVGVDYSKYSIYNSSESYKIFDNSPYAKLMNKFNKPYIGGPSGSTAVLYITLFQFYNYSFTYKNKILLLGTLIADCIPLWHTISEILLTAYPEFQDSSIPKYTLDKDPVLYSIKLLKPFIL